MRSVALLLAATCFVLSTVAVAEAETPFLGAGEWVDLTHDLSSESVFWPTAKPFSLTVDAKGWTERGYYYSAYSFCTAEHGGTHIDAPVHFAEGGQSVDEIPLSRLIGPAIVVDASDAALAARDYQITVEDLVRWEGTHGSIPAGAIVLLRTGYSRYWPEAEKYLGTAMRGEEGAARLHFPGLSPEAAEWLVERGIASVGIDTASIDRGASRTFGSHVALMTSNVPAFENLTDLDRLPPTGAFVLALPAKIRGGSGGPLRIIAWVPNDAGH
jgi:kynurenine formamidase